MSSASEQDVSLNPFDSCESFHNLYPILSNLKDVILFEKIKKGDIYDLVKLDENSGDKAVIFIQDTNILTDEEKIIIKNQGIKTLTIYYRQGPSYIQGDTIDLSVYSIKNNKLKIFGIIYCVCATIGITAVVAFVMFYSD